MVSFQPIPSECEALLKLKGIGHYTAGAIASIAYGPIHGMAMGLPSTAVFLHERKTRQGADEPEYGKGLDIITGPEILRRRQNRLWRTMAAGFRPNAKH